MLSNAYFLAKFRFDTAENEPAKNLQNFRRMHFRKMHFRKMHFRKMHQRARRTEDVRRRVRSRARDRRAGGESSWPFGTEVGAVQMRSPGGEHEATLLHFLRSPPILVALKRFGRSKEMLRSR